MQLDETDSVFADLNSVIPETELLDNSIQKSRAPLPLKSRRNRPSRSRLTDSLSSTEGDEGPDTRSADTPLHSAPVHSFLRDSTLTPELLLSSFDSALARRSPEDPKAHRYRQLTNTTSHDALLPPVPPSPCRSCPETSPVHFRRGRRPESEVLVSDDSQDDNIAESDSPTVVLDKKTKRRFLDLGVTLRRSYVRVKKDNAKRFSLGSRELCENSSRHSGSFVPFSWFSDSHRSSSTSSSPRMVTHSRSPSKSDSQESAFSDEFSPKSPLAPSESRSSHHPYQTLSQSSDERADEPQCVARSWSTQQVCDWLKSLNMEQYVPEFRDKDVDGELLLQMDGTKLKMHRDYM
ncbi:sterile alpha motif domain-containing protein 14-like isoform X2 [Ictalurus furcatus]|uniref:sterile alpha motif domain-containing protein 14-like isoform X2 n=1 Tax=Ictalurus furcatus TaxID=66913 RepID=UPI0023502CC3|nr:sterile alpha motif domain-containing protein 14-like isoform X2 [Ictalurus furcatus]